MTIAQTLADRFDNDGQNFTDTGGTEMHEALVAAGASMTYARLIADGGVYVHIECTSSEYAAGDPISYQFADGSAIVIAGDGWDIEGSSPFSWADA